MMIKTNKLPLFFLLGCCLVVGGLYSLGINGPFVLDDMANLSSFKLLDGEARWHSIVFSNVSGPLGRPLSMLSFYLEYAVYGLDARVFKTTNIVLHLLCGGLAFVFVSRLMRYSLSVHAAHWFATWAAVLWLISPLSTSTVLYVIQRMAILSTLFVLVALIAYERFRHALESVEEKRAWSWLFMSAIAALMGLFSKESAVLLPLLILVIEFYFLPSLNNHRARRIVNSIRVLCGAMIFVAIFAVFIQSDRHFAFPNREYGALERLLTETRILWMYIRAIVIPDSAQFGLFHDDIPISIGLFAPKITFIACASWLLILVGIVFAAFRKPLLKPIAGGIALFLAGHALESTIFNLELYFEHRNYFPGIGIYIALVGTAQHLIAGNESRKKLIASVGVLYSAVLLIALWQRVLIWSDIATLTYSSYMNHTNSPRANAEAALIDTNYGRFDEAIAKLEHAATLSDSYKMGVNAQLVYTHCLIDRPIDSKQIVDRFSSMPVDGSAYTPTAFYELNSLYRKRPCTNVPYKEFLLGAYQSFMSFYQNKEYEKRPALIHSTLSAQIRTMEGLNFLVKTDKTIELGEAARAAGVDSVALDLVESVALIDRGRFTEAEKLLTHIRATPGLPLDYEKHDLAAVEAMLKKGREQDAKN